MTFSNARRAMWKGVYEEMGGRHILCRTNCSTLLDFGTLNAMLFPSRAPLDKAKGWLHRPTNLMLHIVCWSGGYWPLPPQPSGLGEQFKGMGLFRSHLSMPFISKRCAIYACLCNIKYTNMKETAFSAHCSRGGEMKCFWSCASSGGKKGKYYWYSDFKSILKIID